MPWVYVDLERGIHYSFGENRIAPLPINIHRLSYSQNMTTYEAFHYIKSSTPLTPLGKIFLEFDYQDKESEL